MKRVYFLRRADGQGPIKIGCSDGPEFRRKQIGWDMRVDLELLAQAPGDYVAERELQRQFAAHRVTISNLPDRPYPIGGVKEWFAPVPELMALIATVIETGELPNRQVPDRDTLIFTRRQNGETLQSIANDVGLTRERVRQIVSEIKRRIAWAARQQAAA